jgi:hypothetical protein
VIPPAQLARSRRWPGVMAWAVWALTILGLAVIAWLDQLSRQAGQPDLAQLTGGSVVGPVLAAVSAATAGAVLASRRPGHPGGLAAAGPGLSLAWAGLPRPMPPTDSWPAPGALPAAHAVARYWPITIVTAQTAASFVLLLTPTGSLPSPAGAGGPGRPRPQQSFCWWRWRWPRGPLDPRYQVLGGPFDLRRQGGCCWWSTSWPCRSLPWPWWVGAGSLVVRFGRAGGVERLQLRWVAWAAALAVLAAVVALGGLAVDATAVVSWAISSTFAVMPLAIRAAILRYRLYDLDRIISRTLGYGCSRCYWPSATPPSCSAWGGCCPRAPAWPWPALPWRSRRCSSRRAGASSRPSTGVSTGAATTRRGEESPRGPWSWRSENP